MADEIRLMKNGLTELYVKEFSCRNTVADNFRTYADDLCEFQGFKLKTENILFILDRTSGRNAYSGSFICAVPGMWKDVLYQFTGYRFDYVVKFHEANLDGLTPNQSAALLYHELRHLRINVETGAMDYIAHHDLEDWAELAAFGDWEAEGGIVPDVMENLISGGVQNENA